MRAKNSAKSKAALLKYSNRSLEINGGIAVPRLDLEKASFNGKSHVGLRGPTAEGFGLFAPCIRLAD